MNVLAQAGRFGGWGLGEFLIAIVVIGAAVALMYVALQQFGITIPPWVVKVFWICVVCMVVIFAIRFVLSL